MSNQEAIGHTLVNVGCALGLLVAIFSIILALSAAFIEDCNYASLSVLQLTTLILAPFTLATVVAGVTILGYVEDEG